jgi:hypothetical protein
LPHRLVNPGYFSHHLDQCLCAWSIPASLPLPLIICHYLAYDSLCFGFTATSASVCAAFQFLFRFIALLIPLYCAFILF